MVSRDLPKSIMSLGPKLCYKGRPNGQLQKNFPPLKFVMNRVNLLLGS